LPVEIRELVIKAVVVEAASERQKAQRALAALKREIAEECRAQLDRMSQPVNDR
jgi:hypothetical protein